MFPLCTVLYLVHYRASKRLDFHDHVSYHRKVSIDNSTLLSSAPFHVDNEAAGRSTNMYWVEVSHLRSLDKFEWNWYGILPTLAKCLLWSQTCFIRRIYRQKVCTLLVNECKSSLRLLIIVHIWMFININSLAFCTTLIFNH